MKIIHPFIFYSVKFAGGTSDLMYKIAKAQTDAGNQVEIWTGDYNIDMDLVGNSSFKVKIFRSFFDKFGLSIMPYLPIYALLKLKKTDIIHFHVIRTWQNMILYIVARIKGIKYVVDAHGAVPIHKKKRFLKLFFDFIFGNNLIKNASSIIAESAVGVDEYVEAYSFLEKNDIDILSPPFDVSEYKDLEKKYEHNFREKFNINKEDFVITFLGRIHEIKGIDILIKFFNETLHIIPNGKLVIIGGDDGHLNVCKEIINNLKIQDKVIFCGFMSGDEKNECLTNSNVVAQLSRFEQGAWAPIEAVLCGTPIIVSSQTGAGEDVRRLNAGHTVSIEIADEFINAIKEINSDQLQARKRALEVREFIIKNMSFDARVNEYLSLYYK